MGKKAREYKSGDFIFAKVKGYPAWPARVQRLNGKKYFVYFYGTGETANLPSNMIFDYVENKDKFLTKTQKRRDFNDGVRQIEHDFANNVPLEDVIGVPVEAGADGPADETANDSAINDMDVTVDTTANDTLDDETLNTTQADGAVEDSDENGALVIDEGKATKKKVPKEAPKTPATPKAKEAKTPRGKAKKDAEDEEEKKEEEIVSRSGRKIRPKRFVDEQAEDNATPPPKKQRLTAVAESEKPIPEPKDLNIKSFNAVTQSELEELKEPFVPADAEKENILIAYLPSGKYVGIKLFQARPASFKSQAARLLWDKRAASNAITLKMQLEREHITADSVQGQLVMNLNLNEEEKETLDKERETEEKKIRVQFLKTEMRFIELDAQIKTCLSLEKADTDLCLKLMDDMLALDTRPLMLLKHPNCLETVKRLRNYVGNTPGWDLSEDAALAFNKQAHRIRKQADHAYKHLKNLFVTPDGLSFYEYFQERVQTFNTLCRGLDANEILELVQEPLGMSLPSSTSMALAIEAANYSYQEEEKPKKKVKGVNPVKTPKKATPSKGKRQSSRKQAEQEKVDGPTAVETDAVDNPKEPEPAPETAETTADVAKEADEIAPAVDTSEAQEQTDKPAKKGKNVKEGKRSQRNAEKNAKADKEAEKDDKAADKIDKAAEKVDKAAAKVDKAAEKDDKEAEKVDKEAEKEDKVAENEEKPAETANETEKVADGSKDEENAKVDDVAEENAKDVAKDVVNNIENETVEMAEVINTTPKKNSKKAAKDGAKTPKSDKNAKDLAVNNEGVAENEKTAETPETAENKVQTKSPKKAGKDEKVAKDSDQNELEKIGKDTQKNGKDTNSEKRKLEEDKSEEKREETAEPRAKRSRETRENKKTEAPPSRSPTKRKAKN